MPALPEEMYCSQQICIPPSFPYLLRQYAKAAIRTQPTDLLRWSTAYFRCLALNLRPPVKPRLEYPIPKSHFGLTPGWLKALMYQLQNNLYIPFKTLWDRWIGACLQHQNLIEILCLGGFTDPQAVPWNRFVALCAAHLTENLTQSMILICEILTEEPEGGSGMIPLEVFKDVYTFLAAIDASEGQYLRNLHFTDSLLSLYREPPAVVEKESISEVTIEEEEESVEEEEQKEEVVEEKPVEDLVGVVISCPDIAADDYKTEEDFVLAPESPVSLDKISITSGETGDTISTRSPAPDATHKPHPPGTPDTMSHTSHPDEPSTKSPAPDTVSKKSQHSGVPDATSEKPHVSEAQDVASQKSKVSEAAPNTVSQKSQLPEIAPDNLSQGSAKSQKSAVSEKSKALSQKSAISKKSAKSATIKEEGDDKPLSVKGYESVDTIEDYRPPIPEEDSELLEDLQKVQVAQEELMGEEEETSDRDFEELKRLLEQPVATDKDVTSASVTSVESAAKTDEQVEEEPENLVWVNAIPGIGPIVPQELVDTVLDYMHECAKEQHGVVMPRNIRHYNCPPLEILK